MFTTDADIETLTKALTGPPLNVAQLNTELAKLYPKLNYRFTDPQPGEAVHVEPIDKDIHAACVAKNHVSEEYETVVPGVVPDFVRHIRCQHCYMPLTVVGTHVEEVEVR